MNELKQPSRQDSMETPGAEAWVRDLLQRAGKRPPLPASDLAQLRAAVHREWRQQQATRHQEASVWSQRRLLALAAGLLLAVLLGWWWRTSTAPTAAETVATIEVVRDQESGWRVGSELVAGTSVSTDSPLALRLAGGESVRLAADTSVQLVEASRFRLERGAVYVDSGPSVTGDGLRIETRFGVVRDIGTQFEVRIGTQDEPLRIRVREGEVLVQTNGDSRSAAAGEELTLRSGGSVRRDRVNRSGAAWDWILEVAPSFRLEGSSLEDYLAWLQRETGLQIDLAEDDLQVSVSGITLYGSSLEGLKPLETLEVVLPTTGLTYQLEEGTLRVLTDSSAP